VGRGKEDESSTGRIWAVGFRHITACSRLVRVLKLMNRLFFSVPFFGPRINETAGTKSMDTGAQLYLVCFTSSFFRRVCKTAKSDCRPSHVCSFVRMEYLGYHGTDFHEIRCLSIFRKSRTSLRFIKIGRDNGYSTWRPIYIYAHISLNSSWNEKCLDRSCRENQSTHFAMSNFIFENPAVYEIMWKNIVELVEQQGIIWRMRMLDT
jgi:hypothetical protein